MSAVVEMNRLVRLLGTGDIDGLTRLLRMEEIECLLHRLETRNIDALVQFMQNKTADMGVRFEAIQADVYSYGESGMDPADTIRVLVLKPGNEQDRLEGFLGLMSLEDESFTYDALSYTWGTLEKTDRLWLQRQTASREQLRHVVQADDRPSLLSLLESCRDFDATDPRDRLFALLGISKERDEPRLRPDYDEAPEETLRRYAQFISEGPDCMELLYDDRRRDEDDESPSWIPDWLRSGFGIGVGRLAHRISFPDTIQKVYEYVYYRAAGDSSCSRLLVQGMILDEIVFAGSVHSTFEDMYRETTYADLSPSNTLMTLHEDKPAALAAV
ncbi:hypothetical protein H2199_008046 [Coniosporium tulheliwenetii]|uniref:Uncharacterized protein n=1 Tax=Coniosporium tulheliwenetii TaxID=3383036 RepID=A0ACC2YLX4_9PEZI|nr:hypothetical protein H2199_008046 [Cladosporium sp. JES 115]